MSHINRSVRKWELVLEGELVGRCKFFGTLERYNRLFAVQWWNCFEYVETKEVWLIQGIFGAPVQIPLVKVEVDVAGRRDKLLRGLVECLLPGATMLIDNDYSKLFPLAVNVVTRARARMNDCNSDVAVVHSEVANGHVNVDRQATVVKDCAVSSEVRRAVDNLNESTPVSNNDVSEALGANDGTSLVGINESPVNDVSTGAVCLNEQQPVPCNGLHGSKAGQVRSAVVQHTAQSGGNCLVSLNARK